jgi:hypothetical protein
LGLPLREQVLERFERKEEHRSLGANPYDWSTVMLVKEKGLCEPGFLLAPAK